MRGRCGPQRQEQGRPGLLFDGNGCCFVAGPARRVQAPFRMPLQKEGGGSWQVALALMELTVVPGVLGLDRCYMGRLPAKSEKCRKEAVRAQAALASTLVRKRSVRPGDCQSSHVRRCTFWQKLVSSVSSIRWHIATSMLLCGRLDGLVHLRLLGSCDDLPVRGGGLVKCSSQC